MATVIVRLLFDAWTVLSWAASAIFDSIAWSLAWLPYVLMFGSLPAFVFWRLKIDAVKAFYSNMCTLLWTHIGAMFIRVVDAFASYIVSTFRWRCFHFSSCTCFDGQITTKEHGEALAELRASLQKALKDLTIQKSKLRLSNFTSRLWRRRTREADEIVATCQRDHIDFVGIKKANKRFQTLVSDLERENADLRLNYNLERKNIKVHVRYSTTFPAI
ncbi:hypothetical protein ONS95_011729 [Cadophora gregata]|uniref:uncharacterized protein n=1 Tax=Cadophora gregata TaxID=51156 RepID=UPI0026DADAE9|nr:uncharacterized protein ONS95_011729 [Cadophora gregata]KAK0120323.1 hypothetical protein ONS95_011729 [Cadophora gregata]KAK0121356.1 hypothetical protein ONS96_011530 [Cadophora gregata f. sp. sojae]